MQLVNIDRIHRKLAFSTTTPLAANAVYTSPTIDVINYASYGYLVTSDQAGTYMFQYSNDGVTWYNSATTTTSVAANGITNTSGNFSLRYFRLVYTNGSTPQTSFSFSLYIRPL